jgi:hypothetical protein
MSSNEETSKGRSRERVRIDLDHQSSKIDRSRPLIREDDSGVKHMEVSSDGETLGEIWTLIGAGEILILIH